MSTEKRKYLDEYLEFLDDAELREEIQATDQAIGYRHQQQTEELDKWAKENRTVRPIKEEVSAKIDAAPKCTEPLIIPVIGVKIIGKIELPDKIKTRMNGLPKMPKVKKSKKTVATKRKYVCKTHRDFIFKRDGMCLKCFCADLKRLTIDHIKPLSKGGKNKLENYQTLCVKCNGDKGDKTADYRTNKNIAFKPELIEETKLLLT